MPSSVHGPQAAPGPWVLRKEAQAKLCPWQHRTPPAPVQGWGAQPAHAVGSGVFQSCHLRMSSASAAFSIHAAELHCGSGHLSSRSPGQRSPPPGRGQELPRNVTQSQRGHGVRNPHTETSSASVLAAGERRWLPARARFAEQVEPSLGRVTAVGAAFTYQPRSETGLFWQRNAAPGGFLSRLRCTEVLTSGVSSWPATALAFSNSHDQMSILMLKHVPSCPKTCLGRRTRNHTTGEQSVLHRDAGLRHVPWPGRWTSRLLLSWDQTTACRQR